MRICSKYNSSNTYTRVLGVSTLHRTWRNPTSAGPRADLHSARAALWSTHAEHMAIRPRTQRPD
jgi:hypothetical protein